MATLTEKEKLGRGNENSKTKKTKIRAKGREVQLHEKE